MHRDSQNSPDSLADNSSPRATQSESSPLSLGRLREAFAAMLGDTDAAPESASRVGTAHQPSHADKKTHGGQCPPYDKASGGQCPPYESRALCEISPRSVVEAMLLVGRPDNRPISSRELAAAMRGVSPAEIDAAIVELNALYDADARPYRIDRSHAGHRFVLRREFERMRDKFYGRVREAKLSPPAIEVLSIVAYNQPVTAAQVEELRGAASGAVLSTLVRRGLVQLERSEDRSSPPCYRTTDRFLRLFGLESLSTLPRSEELEKA